MPAQVGIIYSKAVVDINEALKRLDTLEGRMQRLEGRPIRIDAKAAISGLENLGKAAGRVWDVYGNLTAGVQQFGDMLVHQGQILGSAAYRLFLVSAPLAAAGAASFKMAQDLETSMAMVGTQLELRGAELDEFIDRVTKGIVDLSATVPLAAKDIADALYYLVSSMTIDPEIATQFLEPIAKAAVAGKATAQQVAEAITPILNVYEDLGKDTEGVEHVLDVLFETVKRGRGEFQDIAIQVGDFIQIAEQAGATFEEAMAAFAMATRVTTAAQAATWIANLYRSLFTPKSVEALQDLGIAVEEVVEGTGKWITVTEVSEKAQDKAAGLTEKHARAIEEQQEAILLYNRQIAKSESTWDDYTGSVKASLETGQMVEGVSTTGINALQRVERAQRNLMKVEAGLAEVTGELTETYTEWTGELVRRPTLDIITDLAEHISTLRSEQEKLNVIYEVFPRLRGMQGAVLFIENLAEITAWEKEFAEATGLTQEAFEIMMQTFESKIGVLKNMFLALGFDLLEEYGDDLKRLIDGITELFAALRELPADIKAKAGAIAGILVALPAVLLGAAGISMALGSLIQFIGLFMAPGAVTAMTAAGVLFGDKMPIFLGAIGAYGGGLQGFATSLGHLAVHFGILSEEDAVGILEGLGITVEEFDDRKIDDIATSIENIATAVSVGIEDFKEWVLAFGDFLRDVQEREGAVGALVNHLERLWGFIQEAAGMVAPKLGLPEKPYEEWGREEKAGLIDKAMAFLIGSKLASWILAGLASGLKFVTTLSILKLAFGVVGSGAGATAATGGTIAGAGAAIGTALSGAIEIALLAGLLIVAERAVSEVHQYLERRWPDIFKPPIPIEEYGREVPLAGEILGMEPPQFFGAPEEAPELTPLGKWFEERFFPWLGEKWQGFYSWLTDYPEEERPASPEGLGLDRTITKIEQAEQAWGTGFLTPIEEAKSEAYTFLDELERKLDGIEEERKPKMKVVTYLRGDQEALFDFGLNKWLRQMEELTQDRTMSIFVKYKYIGEPEDDRGHHLGGYTMHEGGYPPLGMPNVLASEFVMSPYTTTVLERYLGRLNQEKVRSVVTQPQISLGPIQFFKGSVTGRKDAEEAADVIFERVAERARGLAHMER